MLDFTSSIGEVANMALGTSFHGLTAHVLGHLT